MTYVSAVELSALVEGKTYRVTWRLTDESETRVFVGEFLHCANCGDEELYRFQLTDYKIFSLLVDEIVALEIAQHGKKLRE